MLPGGGPLGSAGTAIYLRVIQDFALKPPVRLRNILPPHYLPVYSNSCLPPAINYATAVFTMKAPPPVATQTRTYNSIR